MKARLTYAFLAAVVAALISPVLASAAGPTAPVLMPGSIVSEGFESPLSTNYSVGPTNSLVDPSTAWWGRVSASGSHRTGSWGLWCAGTNGTWPNYLADSAGYAVFPVPQSADYYAVYADFWYRMPSLGAADTEVSFRVGWRNDAVGDFGRTVIGFPLSSAWTRRVLDMSQPVDPMGSEKGGNLSRQAGLVALNWEDFTEGPAETPPTGTGPSIDDFSITGWKYGPPRDVQETVSSNQVVITWHRPYASTADTALEDRPIGYRVFRAVQGTSDWAQITVTPVQDDGTSGTFTDSTVVGATPYIYSVQAFDISDNAGMPSDTTPPSVPTNIGAAALSSTSIRVSWTASNDAFGIKHYLVYLNGALRATVTGTSATITLLNPNTSYSFYVKAVDNAPAGSNTSAASATVSAKTAVTTTPIAGSDRVSTAIEASKLAFPAGAGTVVIATAFNWPDALGGSALAGALDAPILLTSPTSLSSGVAQEIARLGASKAIILGGAGAVSASVATALDKLPGVGIERIAGSNRYETARMIAVRTISVMKAGAGYGGVAFVATGANFPDALGASPLAAAKGWPIYLADPNAGDNAALAMAMKAAGVKKAVVLGGTGVVSSAVQTKLKSMLGTATRLAGGDRYGTAINVAAYGVAGAGLHWDKLAIATGANFPDALAGGVLEGESGSVMLLTPTASLYPGVASTLAANKAAIFEVRFLGGTGAVSAAERTAVTNALK